MASSRDHVLILGCQGAGKTTFISGLAILTRGSADTRFSLTYKDGHSSRYIENLRSHVDRQEWPPPTNTETPLHLSLEFAFLRGTTRFEFVILDYPGEGLVEAMQTMDFETREALKHSFAMANYIIVIVDPTQDVDTPICRNKRDLAGRQDALVQAINQLAIGPIGENGAGQRRILRVAVVVTKSDLLDDADDAKSVSSARSRCGRIKDANESFIKRLGRVSRGGRVNLFEISAYGGVEHTSEGTAAPPVQPQPIGYDALFRWFAWRRLVHVHRYWVGMLAALILVTLCGLSIRSCIMIPHCVKSTRHVVRSGSLEEMLAQLESSACNQHELVLSETAARESHELDRITKELDGSPSPGLAKALDQDLVLLAQMPGGSQLTRVDTLLRRARQVQDDAIYDAILAAKGEEALRLCTEYLENEWFDLHREEVIKRRDELLGAVRGELRGDLHGMKVRDRRELSRKAEAIRDYIGRFINDHDREEMSLAAQVAEGLAGRSEVVLRFKSCGFTHDRRSHEIRCYINGTLQKQPRPKQSKPTNMSTWDYEDWTVRLAAGDRLKIELWDLKWGNSMMAEREFSLIENLGSFDGKRRFELTKSGGPYWKNAAPWVRLEARWQTSEAEAPIGEQALLAYRRFIAPGDTWAKER